MTSANENYDEVSEQAVVGRCIESQEAYDAVSQILFPEDFFFHKYRMVYIALQELHETGEPVDAITVNARYLKQPNVEDDGNTLSWLVSLTQESSGFEAVKVYAQIIRDYSLSRKLIAAGHEIVGIANDKNISAPEKITQSMAVINPILESGTKAGFMKARKAARDSLGIMTTRFENGTSITGLTTGFGALDEKTLGLQDSDLVIIAGRPSHGKTLISMNIAAHVAKTNPVLVFSLEMPTNALMNRMFSSLGGINHDLIKNGKACVQAPDQLTNAVEQINEMELYIDDRGGVTIDDIRARARIGKRKYGCRLVVVDYLQLIHANGETQNLRTSVISAGLKNMAKELECPVIAISQLNRGVESRTDRRPMMSDLRDSGSIEQDADVVAFNYLDEKYDRDSHLAGIGELIIRKQRNGETGTIYLNFEGHYQRFTTRFEAVPEAPKKKKHGSSLGYGKNGSSGSAYGQHGMKDF